MMLRHFFRSSAKLSDRLSANRASPKGDNMTRPTAGEADQPFCGAEISTSTPSAAMSTQTQPLAMQSSTITAPT